MTYKNNKIRFFLRSKTYISNTAIIALLMIGKLSFADIVNGTSYISINTEKPRDGAISSHGTANQDNQGAVREGSVAIGVGAISNTDGSVAIGYGARNNAKNTNVDGNQNEKSAIAIGLNASTTGSDTIAMGQNSNASDGNTIALGKASKALANGALAFGLIAEARVANSVALGAASLADRAGGVSGYDPNTFTTSTATSDGWRSGTYGAVSVGKQGFERQIINVAAGSQLTDAVNLAQLKNLTMRVKDEAGNIQNLKVSAGSYKIRDKDGEDDITTEVVKNNEDVETVLSINKETTLTGKNNSNKLVTASAIYNAVENSRTVVSTDTVDYITVDKEDGADGISSNTYKINLNFNNIKNELGKTFATNTATFGLQGNEGDVVTNTLNNHLSIRGAEGVASTNTNIHVVNDGTTGLNILLNKSLNNIEKISKSDDKTAITLGDEAITLSNGSDDAKLTGIKAGGVLEDSKDAINGAQLYALATASLNEIDADKWREKLGVNNNANLNAVEYLDVEKTVVKFGKDTPTLLKNVADPIEDLDAVNKKYVDEKTNNIVYNLSSLANNAAAMANIPQVSGERLFAVGAGTAYSGGKTASFALGISGQDKNKRIVYKASVGMSTDKKWTIGAGVSLNLGKSNKTEKISDNLENQNKKDIEDLKELVNQLAKQNKELAMQNKILESKIINNETAINNISVYEKRYIVDNFQFSKSIITKSIRNKVLEIIKELPKDKEVYVYGYTDLKGEDKYNLNLGMDRAKEVAKILESKGIKVNYIRSRGYNEIISNRDNQQYKNRRVEIIAK